MATKKKITSASRRQPANIKIRDRRTIQKEFRAKKKLVAQRQQMALDDYRRRYGNDRGYIPFVFYGPGNNHALPLEDFPAIFHALYEAVDAVNDWMRRGGPLGPLSKDSRVFIQTTEGFVVWRNFRPFGDAPGYPGEIL
jgi:hypothetical protein